MPIFGVSQGGESKLPVNQIKNMRGQGLDNNQIIQALQKEGYSSTDIFDGMNQADMPSPQDASSESQQPQPAPNPSQNTEQPTPQQGNYDNSATNEELIEAMIDERWQELTKDFNKVIEWKKTAEDKIVSLEQKFDDLKGEFDKIHQSILQKVDEYDKNISHVGAEVKAMEKVFSKVLPMFTENVKELSNITKEMKGKKDK